jgi:hypothetical protein
MNEEYFYFKNLTQMENNFYFKKIMKQTEGYGIQIYICVLLRNYQCERWCYLAAASLQILGSVEERAQRKSLPECILLCTSPPVALQTQWFPEFDSKIAILRTIVRKLLLSQ